MRGVFLPGQRRVDIRHVDDPTPGPGQVVLAMRASTICGSDLRAIYREHLGTGPEAYCDVVAGHEPCGEIVATGPGIRRFQEGDRVALYHIAGCGLCPDCRAGYMISCTSPLRAAYGWQRDGGHADYLLAEESTCVPLPDELSWVDGACVACGFGTAYQALRRAGVSGRDAVLVVGLGPVGLAAGQLARALGATMVIGTDPVPARGRLAVELEPWTWPSPGSSRSGRPRAGTGAR
ncbi:MAG TPA: alcohol dehydrogenase catalytic domain-containing protein [Actinomycetes bacterium]|nr:alcohol dehydrogenase catalytic domain-containing protein [Actinomycetes bacterium]